jgi:membrane-associated phospholipid phosphatase
MSKGRVPRHRVCYSRRSVNNADRSVHDFLTGLWTRFPVVAQFALEIVGNDLVKGGLVVAILLWYWAQPHRDQAGRREVVVATVASALLASLASRALCHLLPFRARPINTPGVLVPPTRVASWMDSHGSLPSDHSALAFALAAGVVILSPRLGAVAVAYVTLFTVAPRLVLGLHWVTDVAAGAVLGAVTTWMLTRPAVRSRLARPVTTILDRHPGAAMVMVSLVAYGLLTRFEDVRLLATLSMRAVVGVASAVGVARAVIP